MKKERIDLSLTVIWHHIGREHGGLTYTEDIRKNAPETIEQYINLKVDWVQTNESAHQFLHLDENTLVEYSNEADFIIVYFIDKGLQLSLNAKTKSKYPWWVIDVVDITEIQPEIYCSSDLFIDIIVFEDGKYHVLDIDEFETAIQKDILTNEQVSKALKAFHTAISDLNGPNALIEKAERIRRDLVDKSLLKV